jgi:hemerythrin-like metal-binding protein/putative nucleotidyltransferase with HDIG domain
VSVYLPINSSSLRTDTIIGCDLYLLVTTTANVRYTLYCRGDAVFENNKRESLLKKNINRLFIKKDDEQKYYEYLESNFQNIISDTRISSEEKTKIVYSTATNLLKDLMEDPRVGNVVRTKTFAYNMVDYILKEGRAARGLLQIANHEYYTYTHSVNVAAVGALFAKELGFGDDDLKHFCTGILLHDVGKTRISTDILNKKDKLTEAEFAEVKKHPEMGAEILKETGNGFTDEYTVTLQHHENYDGTGYPYGLKKDEIHRSGKVARIIDVYDALTTNRSYATAVKPFDALVEMKEKMSNCFDMELLKEFIRFSGPYDPHREEMSLGISIIDEEHKEFIDIINKVIVTKKHNDKPEEVRKVLSEMINSALKHFKSEETNMIKVNFPEYQLHRNEHLYFTHKAVASINKIINGDYQVAKGALEYLKRWIVNHIQEADRKYIDCFNENGIYNAGLKKDLQIFRFKSDPP